MTWHKECQLGNLLVFSAEFCCSGHGNVRVPASAPLGLISSALLFVTWQREGVSLKTCWSSQQCSAVHEMATWGCKCWSSQPFRHGCTSSCSVALECSCFVPLNVRVVSVNDPFHPSLLLSTIAYIYVVGLFKMRIYSFSLFFFAMSWFLVSFIMAVFLLYDFGILRRFKFWIVLWWRQFPLPCKLCALQRWPSDLVL